jgi:integrase
MLKVSAVDWTDGVTRMQRVSRRGGETVAAARPARPCTGAWLFPGRSPRYRHNHMSYDIVQGEIMPAITEKANAVGIAVDITTRVMRRTFATALRDHGMIEEDRKLLLGHDTMFRAARRRAALRRAA